jgi:hypothetical protein
MNQLLNQMVTSRLLKHTSSKRTDEFYQIGPRKLRVSVNTETGERLETIVKEKLEDIDIWCPNSALDMRISISTETPGLACLS